MRAWAILLLAAFAVGCGKEKKYDLVAEGPVAPTTKAPESQSTDNTRPIPSKKIDNESPSKPSSEEQRIATFLESYFAAPIDKRGKFTKDPVEFEKAKNAYYKTGTQPPFLKLL